MGEQFEGRLLSHLDQWGNSGIAGMALLLAGKASQVGGRRHDTGCSHSKQPGGTAGRRDNRCKLELVGSVNCSAAFVISSSINLLVEAADSLSQ